MSGTPTPELSPPGPLVSTAWLAEHLGRPGLVVADARWRPDGSGRARYEQGHVPGAVFLDIDIDLSSPKTAASGRHPLPAPEAFARAMERVGIGDDTVVVAYDDQSGSTAARLWWMLSVTGHPCAVLDGGLGAWTRSLEHGPAPRPSTRGIRFTESPWPADRIVDTDAVDRLRRNPDWVVVDVRAAERYRGEVEPIDPVAGHIPGARSLPWTESIDPDTGRFRRPEELRRVFEERFGRAQMAAHCGSGVTSCHTLLAMAVAGLPQARLYVGSWSEWVADPDRPVATGPDAG
jgi:thiosulfate/3-mercaptopyruvate sulfurtransferase